MSLPVEIALSICLLYVLTLLAFALGWIFFPVFRLSEIPSGTTISVVIAARNEALTIGTCIQNVLKQDYPAHLIEIILVDDHSEDNTVFEAEKAFVQSPFRYQILKLNELETGKKAALNAGINQAAGALIVTLDADSAAVGTSWLKTIGQFYNENKSAMIIAPVRFGNTSSFLSAFQGIELMGLSLSAAAAARFGKPILCNGANLAFERKAFFEVDGYQGNEHLASGDDIFLLNKMSRKYPGRIHYLKSMQAVVSTAAVVSLRMFIQQRLRWAGKFAANTNLFNFFIGILVFACNFLFVLFAALSCFFPQLAKYLMLMACAKWFIDFLLVFLAALFLKQTRVFWWYPLAMLLSPIYVCCMAALSPLLKPQWKGRKINSAGGQT